MSDAREPDGFFARWKLVGLHSGAGFSRVVLYVLYWTFLLPFGLLARLGRGQPAFCERVKPTNVKSQY